MPTLKTYRVIEFDANEAPRVIRTGLSRNQAREKLIMLRGLAREQNMNLRYIMKRDIPESTLKTGIITRKMADAFFNTPGEEI